MEVMEESEGRQSGSGLSLLGFLGVGGALCALLLNHPMMTSAMDTSSVNQQYVSIARQDAVRVGIDQNLFVNQIYKESSFNPNAVSPTGAIGIAQFMPATAADLGIDPYNPEQSLQAAAQLMAQYQQQYGDSDKALAAYNAGPGAVNSAVDRCGAGWMQCLPSETQSYISEVEQ